MNRKEAEEFVMTLISSGGPEDIYNVTARECLSWKNYQAFGRVTDVDPINARYQDVLNERL